MLRISIWNQGSPVGSVHFDRSLVRIGRSDECELKIDDPFVSALHATLRLKEGVWTLEDNSRNGLMLESNEWLPSRLKIESPLRFKLGRLTLLEIDPKPSAPLSANVKTILGINSPTQLIQLKNDEVLMGRAHLRYLNEEGIETKRTMDTSSLTIGSHPSNDIVLVSNRVSQFHCRIELTQNNFVVTDLQSTNGTLLNGVRVTRAVLNSKADLLLGDQTIFFEIETRALSLAPKSQTEFMGMVSTHPKMQRLFALAEAAAASDAPLFIHGETGTGKELLAKALHQLSPRFQGPFVALNCAALPHDLIESEVFGHEKGSFTGATQAREGAFEAANGGTLFLDEIGELDLSLQAKLLRALESGEIKRVGSNRSIHISVRVISATHRDLKREIEAGRFREDLFFRLHVIPLEIPALRDRLDDLALLVPYLLKGLQSDLVVTPEALEFLKHHSYPGNIRELRNILQRAIVEYEINLGARGRKGELSLDHFRFLDELKFLRPVRAPEELNEREEMSRLLEEVHFNQSEAARRMGLPVSTFHDRMKRYGLEKNRQTVPTRLAS